MYVGSAKEGRQAVRIGRWRPCTSGGQRRLCRGGKGPRVNGAGKPCASGGRARMELESGPYEARERLIRGPNGVLVPFQVMRLPRGVI